MATRTRTRLALLVLCAAAGTAAAQDPPASRPAPPPSPTPSAGAALDKREALKLYGLGLLCERENRLLEAARNFEAAVKLDPESATLHKALIPLYVALERRADALASCRKALDGDPGDFETWFLSSRLHRESGQLPEARAALSRALACPKLKDQPELALRIASELGLMCEEAKDVDGALAAYGTLAALLEHPEPLLEAGPVTRADINARAAEVYEHMGTLCIQAKRLDQAVQAFAKAQGKIEPEVLKKRLSFHLAKVRYAQENWLEALTELDKYLDTQPPGTDAYELKVTLLQQLGRPAEVLPQLESYAAREPHNLALQLLLADRYAREQRWAQAEQRYKKVAEESPGPEVYRGLLTLYKRQDDREGRGRHMHDAVHLLDQALADGQGKDAMPGDAAAAARARAILSVLRENGELVKAMLPAAVQELTGGVRRGGTLRTTQTCFFLAVLGSRNHQLDDAERLFRQCLRQGNPQIEAEVYDGLIRVLFAKRNYKEVINVCNAGLKTTQATNRLLFHYNLAEAWLNLGNTAEALKEADQAVSLAANDSNRLAMRRMHVSILTAAGKFDQAEAECQAMFKEYTQPGDVRNIRYSLSNVYSTAHRYEQSEEQLRLILKEDPNDDTANNDLGYIMADRGKNLEEAEQLIRKAIQLEREQRKGAKVAGPDGDVDHAAFIDSLGWVLFRRGRVEEALKELERATVLPDGEDPVIWDHLGDVYLRLGQPDKARAAWEKSEKLYGTDGRRRQDGPYQELKRKLKLLKTSAHR